MKNAVVSVRNMIGPTIVHSPTVVYNLGCLWRSKDILWCIEISGAASAAGKAVGSEVDDGIDDVQPQKVVTPQSASESTPKSTTEPNLESTQPSPYANPP